MVKLYETMSAIEDVVRDSRTSMMVTAELLDLTKAVNDLQEQMAKLQKDVYKALCVTNTLRILK